MIRSWLGFVLSVVVCLLPVVASAQVDARKLFTEGQSAYAQGDYDTAIAKWTEAYSADPRPLIQYNLGGAYERSGKVADAVAAFDKYLATAPEDDRVRRAEVSAKVERLRARLKETGIVVTGAPEGAEILIDGKTRGRTPRPDPIPLEPGSHNVVLKLAGYEDFNAAVAVGPGERVEVTGAMQAAEDNGGGALPPGASQPEAGSGEFPLVPVILMAGGGAVFAGGLVIGILASGKASDSKTGTDSAADSAKTLALVADITMGVGIAVAATGLVLFLLDGSDDDSTDQPVAVRGPRTDLAVAPVITPTFAGATASLSF